jgi:hypothetical protein
MASIKVTEIIKRVETILQDSNLRWPRLELQSWLNEAYLNIILARPDANALTGTYTCTLGTRQNVTSVFPSALRLLDVTRNLAATSSKRVIRQVDRHVLDDQRPAWHAETASVDIQHWTFDPRQPKEFFLYPPATVAAEVEVVYTAPVGAHALTENQLDPAGAEAAVILLDDIYAGPLVDWICYRAYSKDAEYGENANRAAGHLAAFTNTIGAKTTTDNAANPNVPSDVT